jgi:hypothetical protein
MKLTADDLYVWRVAVISAWKKDHRLGAAVAPFAVYLGIPYHEAFGVVYEHYEKKLPVAGRMFTRAWLGEFFREVSDALWDGAPDAQVLDLWARTPPERRSRVPHENAGRASTRAAQYAVGRRLYAHGWRAKTAWNVVK